MPAGVSSGQGDRPKNLWNLDPARGYAARMKRQSLFLLVVLGLFLYVGTRIASGIGAIPTLILMAILFIGIGGYRSFHALKFEGLRRVLLTVVHLEMAFLSFVFAFILLRDLIFLPLSFIQPGVSELAFGLLGTVSLFGLSAVCLLAGVLIARSGPRIVRIEIPIRDLPQAFDRFSIAQISDLHVNGATAISFVERVVRKTLSLNPSMVALTGDIGDGDLEESKRALEPLRELKTARFGSFFVPGNHEYYWNGPSWIHAFDSLGFKTLLNSHQTLDAGGERLIVAGVLDPASQMVQPGGGPDPKKALEGSDPRLRKILLAHQPGIAGVAAELGFDLQLSGHTHAGQFFPWTLIIGRFHEFAKGLGKKASMWVYVNPGTGSWGPPVRLGSRTEITLLTLVREG